MTATKTRRTPDQRAAYHQAKANRARAQATKQARDLDARRKILIGAGLTGLANAGGAAAAALIHRIKVGLVRPHDRAAFGLEPLPEGDAPQAEPSLEELTEATRAALKLIRAAEQDWRNAVVAWERRTGRSWLKDGSPEYRRRNGLGAIGELLEAVIPPGS